MSSERALQELRSRLDRLERRDTVRAVVDEYFSRCDDLRPDSDLEALGDLFAPDATWRGGGSRYGASFGEHVGRDAIVAFLGSYASPQFFRSNVHLLANEHVSIADDLAVGRWQMVQMPSFADGSDWLLVAAIEIQLIHRQARWLIASFSTRNLLSRRIGGGWSSTEALPVPQGDLR